MSVESRRLELRGGRSVRQVSRDQHDLDKNAGEWLPIRNRMSWAKNPSAWPKRIEFKNEDA